MLILFEWTNLFTHQKLASTAEPELGTAQPQLVFFLYFQWNTVSSTTHPPTFPKRWTNILIAIKQWTDTPKPICQSSLIDHHLRFPYLLSFTKCTGELIILATVAIATIENTRTELEESMKIILIRLLHVWWFYSPRNHSALCDLVQYR